MPWTARPTQLQRETQASELALSSYETTGILGSGPFDRGKKDMSIKERLLGV